MESTHFVGDFVGVEPYPGGCSGAATDRRPAALLPLLDIVSLVDNGNDPSPTLAPEEIVDLVDEEDHVLGKAPRREIRARNLLHREVAAIVRNPVGEIYVHRRADTKDVFPGMYDMFVAGVVTSGESYDDAVRRELTEELGVRGVEPALLFKSRYHHADINWWTCCYEVIWDRPAPKGHDTPRPRKRSGERCRRSPNLAGRVLTHAPDATPPGWGCSMRTNSLGHSEDHHECATDPSLGPRSLPGQAAGADDGSP